MSYLNIDYSSYMQSEAWWARKAEYYKTHAKRCSACGSKKNIHLHHMTYERLGRERDSDMAPLCEKCHDEVHRLSAENSVASLTRVTLDFIAVKSRARSSVVRAERKDAARGVGERKPGERRYAACAPAEKKPKFIPRNLRSSEFPDVTVDIPDVGSCAGLNRKAKRQLAKERKRAVAQLLADRNAAVLRDRGIVRPSKSATSKQKASPQPMKDSTRAKKEETLNESISKKIAAAPSAEFSIAGEGGKFRLIDASVTAAGETILNFVSTGDGRKVSVPPTRVDGVARKKKR